MSGSLLDTTGRAAYQLAFQISPIILTNGIAGNYGGALPILTIMQPTTSRLAVLGGGIDANSILNLDDTFAHFTPVPGGKLINLSYGQYPFANQNVAANAVIFEPLTLSMRMSIPVKNTGGQVAKFLTMSALQATLQQHANLGGTYAIATPAFIYTDCLLLGLTDITQGETPIPQNTWQWDFMQPLVTLQQAQAAQSTFMTSVTNGLQTNGSLNTTATSSAVPSLFSGVPVAGQNVPGGFSGNSAAGSTAPAPVGG